MTQAVTLVKRALFTIGAHSEINPATPEMLQIGVDYLADLLEDWDADGIELGTLTPTNQNTDISEPSGSRHAIIMALAVRMAPVARVELAESVRGEAQQAFRDLCVKFEKVYLPDREVSPDTASGAGNRRGSTA